jgi:NADH:ubiquinone oxidoreductase subunit 6 (subunit J)
MDKNASSAWTPYLKHPLVLAGYVIMLFTFVVTAIIKSRQMTSGILTQTLHFSFTLGLIAVVLGFILAYRKTSRKNS